ncbi:MAG TPA: prolyl oligopeptidase family serine peptidase, partial [bacterium]|nr:prolyl oligopeptidase family serine peptidase [bacterium]
MMPNTKRMVKILLLFVSAFLINCQQKSKLPIKTIKPAGTPAQIEDGEIIQEALILKVGRFPRRNVDPIEASIIKDQFVKPEIGDKVNFNENESSQWKKIEADSAGWFQSKKLRNAYVYVNYKVDKDQVVLLEGMGHRKVYINGIPRIGNRYQLKDESEPWEPQYGYSFMPVKLKKGDNHLVFNASRGRLKIKFRKLRSALMINPNDPTFPDIIEGKPIDHKGAVIIINGTDNPQKRLSLVSSGEKLHSTETQIPVIPPMSIRKVPFKIEGQPISEKDKLDINLSLVNKDKQTVIVDTTTVQFSVKEKNQTRKNTFISDIDGSLQYYAVNPIQTEPEDGQNALVLSVHGAAVEALNQANSYYGKDWAYIVSPTNRRPYGYDWEDWGRIDALEVLNIAKEKYSIDPNQVYLTGHSMGGHGTWYLGVTYPDKWAAIGPSAGWVSFWTYVFGRYNNSTSPSEKMILRSIRPSDTYGLVDNLQNKGIYIIHGQDDQVFSIDQSYQMADTLDAHNINYEYHYEPEAGHWWDNSDEPGADCVDWPPLFDYFARHRIPDNRQIRDVDFTTANPEVSAWSHWLGILAQEDQLDLSNAKFRWNPGSGSFVGHTKNVARLGL